MRFQAILVLTSIAFALASPTGSAPGESSLSVSLSNARGKTVDSIEDLVLLAKVTNKGSEPVKIVKYGGILDGSNTQSFLVKKGDKEVKFAGVLPQLDLNYDDEEMYTTLDAGESVSVEHKVAALYDFSAVGPGEFTFEPLVKTAAQASLSSTTSKSFAPSAIIIDVTTDVQDRHLEPVKRATDTCTDATRKAFIDASYAESKALARAASSYVATNGANALFQAYWKSNSPASIQKRFDDVANENVAGRTLNCADITGDCSSGRTIAYTIIRTSNIYFCDIFYREVDTRSLCAGTTVNSRNIRGGTTLHEMIHANSVANNAPSGNWVRDVGYGCPFDQSLSPKDQYDNADNHNCFATQVYKTVNCP
jgi:deuterolysin